MKSPSFRPLAVAAVALLGLGSAQADTILAPTAEYTIDYTQTGGMTLSASVNLIRFGHESVEGLAPSASGVVAESGALSATFQAAPGKIFDRLYFQGISFGTIVNGQGGAAAWIDWTVNGGTFEGGSTYGGDNDGRGFAREWEITGPSTGTSFFYDGYWFQMALFDFNHAVPGSGYYSIGASSFSMDLSALVQVYDQGGVWAGYILPHQLDFSVSFIDAPISPAGVPDSASTAGLMLLAFAGMAGVRRFALPAKG